MSEQSRKPIEQIVAELGRYPLDAFLFIQECIGAASHKTHGRMSPGEAAVSKWMAEHEIDVEDLRLRCQSGDLPAEIAGLVEELGGPEKLNRHVTGQQLRWAVRDVATERWGLMARAVLARWNVRRTEDIGAIVFALVESEWLRKQPTDRIEDFDHVFDFAAADEGEQCVGHLGQLAVEQFVRFVMRALVDHHGGQQPDNRQCAAQHERELAAQGMTAHGAGSDRVYPAPRTVRIVSLPSFFRRWWICTSSALLPTASSQL